MPTTVPDNAMLAQLQRIEAEDFGQENSLSLPPHAAVERLPMVRATVVKHTRSFSAGQKVYIHDGFWGRNERVLVVGRYRRKHHHIFGVMPIKNLDNFRPDYVYHPAVLAKFQDTGYAVDVSIFRRFFERPDLPTPAGMAGLLPDSWFSRLWTRLFGGSFSSVPAGRLPARL